MNSLNTLFSEYSILTLEQICEKLNTTEKGLSSFQVVERTALWGKNEIKGSNITWLTIIKNQFINPFVCLFIIISIVYFLTHQVSEAIVIFIIIVVNVSVGFYQEYYSNKAMMLLSKYLQSTVKVKRDNHEITISTKELVPGDMLMLCAGDIIPADCRFIETTNLVIDESSLTGESLPVTKNSIVLSSPALFSYAATNCGFAGTTVLEGEAIAIVYAIGMSTNVGTIATLATKGIHKSNLAQGTKQLARVLLLLTFVSIIAIFGINIFLKWDTFSFFNLLLFTTALAVSAIPAALPAVITFCLSRGAAHLKKYKVIVKRLSSIEDLGGIEVLCTDKTGTLTENLLSVGDMYGQDKNRLLLEAFLSFQSSSKNQYIAKGFDLALNKQMTEEQKSLLNAYILIKEIPFSYQKRRNISLVFHDNNYVLITQGIVEEVVANCIKIESENEKKLFVWMQKEELKGNRVIAIASKKIDILQQQDFVDSIKNYDNAYTLTGLISFYDPLKKSSFAAITKAQKLGVSIKIISGDSKYVCYTIAEQLGLEKDINNVVLGNDFEKSTEEQKLFLVNNRSIFARITPEQKYQIICYLQRMCCVGYVGDGINDAPALKAADVSIAVIEAAPVAKEAADILLLQKDLLDIIVGIEEGRKIVINTVKYIKITISSNFGNFYSLAFSSFLIDYLPMLPLQLVFANLLTDFPMIALSTDSVSSAELKKPLRYDIKDISFVALIFGLLSCPFDFMIFVLFKSVPSVLHTSWFISTSLTQLSLIFSLRTKLFFLSAIRPSFELVILSTFCALVAIVLPFTDLGHLIFSFQSPMNKHMVWIIGVVVCYFITTESVKMAYYHIKK